MKLWDIIKEPDFMPTKYNEKAKYHIFKQRAEWISDDRNMISNNHEWSWYVFLIIMCCMIKELNRAFICTINREVKKYSFEFDIKKIL